MAAKHRIVNTEPAISKMKKDHIVQGGCLAMENPFKAFTKETLINGSPSKITCVNLGTETYTISRGPVSVAQLEDEWFDDVLDPEKVIRILKDAASGRPDIFTFWERVPAGEPKYPYHFEWESLAVLPVSTYENWFNKQIKGTTRNMIRKSQKAGIQVRDCVFDENFVRGMTGIFNETPVRQGRSFWHYGKDIKTVQQQFSRYLYREDLIGAYHGDELSGFVMLGNAKNFGLLGQFLSKLAHRDKAVNNALIAHAVQVCERRRLPFLVYGYWGASSLGDFKHNSGFGEMRVPRYYVPLTAKGKLALQLGIHKGWKAVLPGPVADFLKKARKSALEFRAGRSHGIAKQARA